MFHLLPDGDDRLPVSNGQPVQPPQRRGNPPDVRASHLIGFPDDIFQCIIKEMGIDLPHEHLQLQLLFLLLALHLFFYIVVDLHQHGVVVHHHALDLPLVRLRFHVGLQIAVVYLLHGSVQHLHRLKKSPGDPVDDGDTCSHTDHHGRNNLLEQAVDGLGGRV